MSYTFTPNRYYRMPTHFGPALGPRQGIDGRRYANVATSKDTVLEMMFAADPTQLDALLPPGFCLREPAVVCISFGYGTEVEWLAGRGYNVFGVTVPVTYQGEQEVVKGDFQLVLWENMPDPIITGREELGFAKIYCEIPDPQFLNDQIICRASWDGFEFARFQVSGLKPVSLDALPTDDESEGLLHYKYFPKTGAPGEADVAYATLTPADWPNLVIDEALSAKHAEGGFIRSTWEQLPTLVNIVNTLSDLKLGECLGATVTKSHGAKDLSDQRIVR